MAFRQWSKRYRNQSENILCLKVVIEFRIAGSKLRSRFWTLVFTFLNVLRGLAPAMPFSSFI
jgi:hypothetical protein